MSGSLAELADRLDEYAFERYTPPHCETLLREASATIRALAARLDGGEWVSVKDRLPDDDARVLCAFDKDFTGSHRIGVHWFKRSLGVFDAYEVTHWQPLPPAPTGEQP